jgi:hypothetical protein
MIRPVPPPDGGSAPHGAPAQVDRVTHRWRRSCPHVGRVPDVTCTRGSIRLRFELSGDLYSYSINETA